MGDGINARGRLTGNQLKLIAIIAMTVDHLTWTLCPGYSLEWYALALHLVGRLTVPIMWFFIAEGYHYTHDFKKYAARLFLLAFVSHFAYNFCFGKEQFPLSGSFFDRTSVAWSLAWGLVLLKLTDDPAVRDWQKLAATAAVCVVTFPADWSCVAVMAIVSIGTNRGNFRRQMAGMTAFVAAYAVVCFFFIDRVYAILQLGTCLAIPLLRLYNGERGKNRYMGKFFYFYYPAHLAVCGVIRLLLR